MKKLFLFLLVLPLTFLKAQNVELDGHSISIGDNLEQVISMFDTSFYRFEIDTLKPFSIEYVIFKKQQLGSAYQNMVRLYLVGYLYFNYVSAKITKLQRNLSTAKDLYKIGKVWNSSENFDNNSILQSIFSIIEKEGVDKYSIDISYNKNIEPNHIEKTVDIKLKDNVSLELYYNSIGHYEIIEYITVQDNFFNKYNYFLIFNDPQHLINKSEEFIIKKFNNEKKAEDYATDLALPYLDKGYAVPNFKITKIKNDISLLK